ncbi:DUF1413 domain-containing protein [uncultured Thalassospira sp.]|uniref:DUF1413 domain-containing protein n=1 Tax=uncultured Thalassospira sp. TaxID=404382 RepID=UPI0030DD2D5D|tara:strand:+ start:1968 stop:2201 length:234 start_codon:yes stop_codon:yes gene_type:complete
MTDDEITRLRHLIAKHPPGEFHFPEIYGPDWDRLYIGDKVKRGHAFMNAVRAGKFPGVTDTGAKKGGGRVYQKIENP